MVTISTQLHPSLSSILTIYCSIQLSTNWYFLNWVSHLKAEGIGEGVFTENSKWGYQEGLKSESVSHSVVSDSLRLFATLCSPPGSYVHRISQARTELDSHSLLQGIFPTQGPNPGLLHRRQILYHWSHRGNPTRKG